MIDKSPLYMWVIVQQRATTAVARDCSVMRLSCSRRTFDMTAALQRQWVLTQVHYQSVIFASNERIIKMSQLRRSLIKYYWHNPSWLLCFSAKCEWRGLCPFSNLQGPGINCELFCLCSSYTQGPNNTLPQIKPQRNNMWPARASGFVELVTCLSD